MKPKRLLSVLVAAAMIAGAMPATVMAGRLDYEPEETEVTEAAETEEKETSKPAVKETKPSEKETEPEVKETEPEVKETEPVKESEETKETEADKTEEEKPEESKKADEQVPEESAASEPEAEKAPEATAKVKAKKATDLDSASIKFANGKLTWPAIDNAVKYRICLPSSEFAYTTDTEFDICSFIDEQIEKRKIFKDNRFEVYVIAIDSTDYEFTGDYITITYNTKAEPKTTIAEITNVKISSSGVVSWDQYGDPSDIEGYYIRVIGAQYTSDFVSRPETSFDLKSFIPTAISNTFKEQTAYKIQIVAVAAGSWDHVAESGYVTYNYKKANTMTVKAKTVKAKKNKKKNQSFKRSKVLTIKKAVGKLTFAKVSGNSKITVNKTSGKLTVKKKMKKGTYKVKISVRAAGNSGYISSTKTVTVKVKVR